MAQRLGGGTTRAFRIQISGNESPVTARTGIFGVRISVITSPEKLAGMFLVPNWELAKQRARAKNAPPNGPEWMLVPSVYAALRQTMHTLHTYGVTLREGEKSLVESLREKTRELNMTVLGLGMGGDPELIRADLQALRSAILDPLRRVRNENKVAAREQLIRALAITDSRGRVNPQAARARTVSADHSLSERMDEMLQIEPRIAARHRVLLSLIQLSESCLDAVSNFLALNARHDAAQRQTDPLTRKQIALQCIFLAQSLDALDFWPYREMCARTAADLRRASHLLSARKAPEAHEVTSALNRCRVAITIKECQVAFERAIYRITRAAHRDQTPRTQESVMTAVFTARDALRRLDDTCLARPVAARAAELASEACVLLRTATRPGEWDAVKIALTRVSVAL